MTEKDIQLGPYLLGPNDTPENGIYTGDARELAKTIPDESVDLIFTDPPYSKKYLYLYEWLSEMASQKLRSGGYLFVYAGMVHPQVIQMLCKHLNFFYTHILYNAAGVPKWWSKKLYVGYKPCFVLTKGEPSRIEWMSALHFEPRDKTYHKWGQSEDYARTIIDKLTIPQSVILDPLVGGGTVPAVCKQLGRRYLAFEIDPDTAQLARDRVHQTQLPLFVLEPEQTEMIPC